MIRSRELRVKKIPDYFGFGFTTLNLKTLLQKQTTCVKRFLDQLSVTVLESMLLYILYKQKLTLFGLHQCIQIVSEQS